MSQSLVAESGSDEEEQGGEKEHTAAPDDLESPAENVTACSTNATGGGDNWVESDCVSLNATDLTNFGTASPKARRPSLSTTQKRQFACKMNENTHTHTQSCIIYILATQSATNLHTICRFIPCDPPVTFSTL